jgi:glycosyltransferase involved in cell wall biosynthesis
MMLYYVAFSIIPSDKANSIQVMRMCEAFAGIVDDVRLFCRNGGPLTEDLFDYYGVRKTFQVRAVRVPGIRFINRFCYALVVAAELRQQSEPVTVYLRDQFVAGIVCRMRGNKHRVVLEVHAPPTSRFWHWWLGGVVRSENFSRLVVISDALANEYQRLFPELPKDKVVVAHDGASDVGRVIPKARRDATDGSSRRVALGYVGSLRPGKGTEIIQELASRLPQFDFHVVGGDEESVRYWKSRASNTNLVFHGFVSPMRAQEYIGTFDIVLAPYQPVVLVGNGNVDIGRWMSPLKIFEYMSHGKPIIASDLPVLREVLIDGHNALLADPSDAGDWSEKIVRLVADAELRRVLGAAARKDFQDKYTWEGRAKLILGRVKASESAL